MPSFGNTSMKRLVTCCDELQEILNRSIRVIDYSIIEGSRTMELQNHYYDIEVSTLRWPNSKHNITEDQPKSDAVDIWPYTREWGALSGDPTQIKKIATELGREEIEVKEFVYKAFAYLAGVHQGIAFQLGYKLIWGGDWNGDGNMLDQKFHDLPHLELVRSKP